MECQKKGEGEEEVSSKTKKLVLMDYFDCFSSVPSLARKHSIDYQLNVSRVKRSDELRIDVLLVGS